MVRRSFAIDLPDRSIVTLSETHQPDLVRLTLNPVHGDPVDVLLDETTLGELCYLRYSFNLKPPAETVVNPTNPVLSLAAA